MPYTLHPKALKTPKPLLLQSGIEAWMYPHQSYDSGFKLVVRRIWCLF